MVRLLLLLVLVAKDCWAQDEVELEPLPDYYATLNVSPKASVREIKKSFRKLAQFYHPDKNKDETAQDIFQELSEAYSVLSDKQKKTEYDQLFFYEFEEFSDEVMTEQEYQEEDFTEDEETLREQPEDDQEPLPEEDSETLPEEEEDIQETEDDFKAYNARASSDSKKNDDIWEDLDDEALFKVLKFLADHDYEITKKTVYTKAEETQHGESEAGRDSESSRHRRAAEPTYRREEGSRQHYKSHTQAGHDRTYTPAPPTYKRHNDHKPEYRRANDHMSHYNDHRSHHNNHRSHYNDHRSPYDDHRSPFNADHHDRYRSSGPQYCRTNVRYEGNVKITQKTCY